MEKRVELVDVAPVEQVPIDKLTATQATVRPAEVALLSETSAEVKPGRRSPKTGLLVDRPIVVKRNGKFLILDGHHRTAAAKERGEKTIGARVLDLSGGSKGLSTWAKEKAP